jgi:hypothetical protein
MVFEFNGVNIAPGKHFMGQGQIFAPEKWPYGISQGKQIKKKFGSM